MRTGLIAAAGLLLVLMLGCRGEVPAGQTDLAAPPAPETLTRLERILESELTRLGKDPAQTTITAPSGPENAVFDLALTIVDAGGNELTPGPGVVPAGVRLSWTERLVGDYDQNGEANIGDLTPLGGLLNQHVAYDDPALHGGIAWWPSGDPDDSGGADGTSSVTPRSGAVTGAGLMQSGGTEAAATSVGAACMRPELRRTRAAPTALGDGALNWRYARVDGEPNGEINPADVTPIAQHWKEALSGYLIERGVNRGLGQVEWDTGPLDLGGGAYPSVPRAWAAGMGPSGPDPQRPVRYSIVVPLSEPEYAHYFRVLPYETGSAQSGAVSNTAAYLPQSAGDTTPPVWQDTVGVQRLAPHPGEIAVEFGTALDEETPPVSYRVYWAAGDAGEPGAPFDYGTAEYVDVAASPGTITGLTDGQDYRVAVRARDAAAPANEELNTVLLGATAGAQDIYPPEWQGRVGIADLLYGNGSVYVVFDSALDSHTDEYGTWESGPVTYRVYYGLGTTPDWGKAEHADFTDIGLDAYVVPIDGLDTTLTRWFAVRALDASAQHNEDANNACLVGNGVAITTIPLPGAGPGVPATAETDIHYSKFVFNRDRSKMYLLVPSYDPPEADGDKHNQIDVWLSIYSYKNQAFTHIADKVVLPRGWVDRMYDARILEDGDLALLYYINAWEGDTIVYTKLLSGQVEIDELGANRYMKLAHFNCFDQPIVMFWEYVGTFPNQCIDFYTATLDPFTPTQIWHSEEANKFLLFDTKYCARLVDGYISLVASFQFFGIPNPEAVFSTNGIEYSYTEWVNEDHQDSNLSSIYGWNVDSPIFSISNNDDNILTDEIDKYKHLTKEFPLTKDQMIADFVDINDFIIDDSALGTYNYIDSPEVYYPIHCYTSIYNAREYYLIFKDESTYSSSASTSPHRFGSAAVYIGLDATLSDSVIAFSPSGS